jgi:hypothetical protein
LFRNPRSIASQDDSPEIERTMMFAKLSNVRIGTKLAVISGLSILLVALMAGGQMWGNSKVRSSIAGAKQQQEVSHDVVAVKAAERRMQISVRDIRLASDQTAMDRAIKILDASGAAATKYLTELQTKLEEAENRARTQSINDLVTRYAAEAKELAAIRGEALSLFGKNTPDALAQIARSMQVNCLPVKERRSLRRWRRRSIQWIESATDLAVVAAAYAWQLERSGTVVRCCHPDPDWLRGVRRRQFARPGRMAGVLIELTKTGSSFHSRRAAARSVRSRKH